MANITATPVVKGGRLSSGSTITKCAIFTCVEDGELEFTFKDGTTENRTYTVNASGENNSGDNPWVSVTVVSGTFDFA